ncbi:MAG: glycerol-3-phosphate acyltransferase [Oscillospiraceae bacterium]|nr:glycerol-3-phosphate acyltransferase [Oscillospiraceae bacterium]
MKLIFSMIIGYLLGTLSPSAFLAKLKKKNLREEGTQNLGATNTMLTLGTGYGALVLFFDLAKAAIAVKLGQLIAPAFALSGLLSGSAAVLGHIYPFYMKFKGGKGLAAYGGLILGLDPILFLILLIISTACMFVVNYSAGMPMSAGVLFPVLYGLRTHSIVSFLFAAAISAVIIWKHFSNLLKGRNGEDVKVRDYAVHHLFKKKAN